MAISGPPAPAAATAAAAGEERGWEDAADDADAISNVPSREARQEMIKAVRATFDRIHVLSSMDEELKRLLVKEFRVVTRAHGEAVATKGEPSTRFYIVHRCRSSTKDAHPGALVRLRHWHAGASMAGALIPSPNPPSGVLWLTFHGRYVVADSQWQA
jgi:hypothetical protein